MIIWRGLGILVIVVAVASVVALDHIGGTKEWRDAHKNLSEFLTFFITAIVLYGLAWFLKKNDQPRVVIDKATGQEVHLRRGDSLFFIPVGGWPFIVLLFAFYKLFATT